MDTRLLSSPPNKVASSDGMKERSQFVPFWHLIFVAGFSFFLSSVSGGMWCSVRYTIIYGDVNFSMAESILVGILTVVAVGILVLMAGCYPIYVAALLFKQHLPRVALKIKSAWDNIKCPIAVCAAACCCSLLLSVIFFYLLNEATKILIVKYEKHPFYWCLYSTPYIIGCITSLSLAAFCVGRRCFISIIDSCLY